LNCFFVIKMLMGQKPGFELFLCNNEYCAGDGRFKRMW
jgi:hypothetical protein